MIRTAESVSPKHPDKVCDRIADAILDECLKQDPNTRSAIEVLGGHGTVVVIGELTTEAYVNIREVVHGILEDDKYGVMINIARQSAEIAGGVDVGGAGDQGVMIGYACSENSEMMPQEYYLARSLNKFLYNKQAEDGKTQVTLDGGKVSAIVASWANVKQADLKELVLEWLIETELKKPEQLHINPAGDWSISGFEADTGLSGRKIVIDNYGPRVPIGGGSFSGKDGTKVDRGAAYKARQKAVEILKQEGAKEVYVHLAYAIGYNYPVQATAIVDGKPLDLMDRKEELQPLEIIKDLKLREPSFTKTAEYGHFGQNYIWG